MALLRRKHIDGLLHFKIFELISIFQKGTEVEKKAFSTYCIFSEMTTAPTTQELTTESICELCLMYLLFFSDIIVKGLVVAW